MSNPRNSVTVLAFTPTKVNFRTDSLSLEDRDFLFGASTSDWSDAPISHILFDPNYPEDQVNAALLMNFRFLDKAARARWKNGEDFEMYRYDSDARPSHVPLQSLDCTCVDP
jgi:hypothetical protein